MPSKHEKLIRGFHEIRKANDGAAVEAQFTDDAEFGVNGAPMEGGVACHICGRDEFSPVLHRLAEDFSWDDIEFHEFADVGDDTDVVFVRYTLKTTYQPTGRKLDLTIVDRMEIRGDRIAHMVQFVDTAEINAVLAGA